MVGTRYALCSHKQMHFTNAFAFCLSMKYIVKPDWSVNSLRICAWLCNMYNNNLHRQWTCTSSVIARSIHVEYGIDFLFPMYKPCGLSQYPSQSVSLMAHSHLIVWIVKPFLQSQCKMVANSLMWWFQSMEKAPTSSYIWSHNIIQIYIIWILIKWIHVIGIHIYYMNSSSIFQQYISIIAWAMSGEHLSPIKSLKYLYLPNGVMMVQESWLLLSSSNV